LVDPDHRVADAGQGYAAKGLHGIMILRKE
jgi:hypothetical protein